MPRPSKTLDLFSGTGGIAYALRGGIARTAAYCEVSPDARAILRGNMARRHLDRAPVEEDVTTLDPARYADVEMIAGGFPCVGMSRAGRREGLKHPASALFYRVVELAEAIRPPFVFLENVSTVVNSVLDEIVAQLHGRLGYELRWVVVPAFVAGAPQIRARWYLLAVRPGTERAWTLGRVAPFDWSGPGPARMVPEGSEGDPVLRLRALGNGVVPDAVRLAFLFLASGGRVRALPARATTLTLQPMDVAGLGAVALAADAPFRNGGFVGGARHAFPDPFRRVPRPDLGLRLVPLGSGAPTNPAISTELIRDEFRLRQWATPRFKGQGACAVLTYRCTQDLQSQMKFEAGTPARLRGPGYRPSVAFVEWLMGVPPGFTSPAEGSHQSVAL